MDQKVPLRVILLTIAIAAAVVTLVVLRLIHGWGIGPGRF